MDKCSCFTNSVILSDDIDSRSQWELRRTIVNPNSHPCHRMCGHDIHVPGLLKWPILTIAPVSHVYHTWLTRGQHVERSLICCEQMTDFVTILWDYLTMIYMSTFTGKPDDVKKLLESVDELFANNENQKIYDQLKPLVGDKIDNVLWRLARWVNTNVMFVQPRVFHVVVCCPDVISFLVGQSDV